ncbi:hypothetical protein YC2023_030819 [Brassica napus]
MYSKVIVKELVSIVSHAEPLFIGCMQGGVYVPSRDVDEKRSNGNSSSPTFRTYHSIWATCTDYIAKETISLGVSGAQRWTPMQ